MKEVALDPDEWVRYDPPIGQTKAHKPRIAWPLVQDFLAAQQAPAFESPLAIGCWAPPDGKWADSVASARLRQAKELFGACGRNTTATIDFRHLDAAIAFALDDDLYPREQRSIEVSFRYRFAWPDFPPRLAQPKEWRSPRSEFYVTIGRGRIGLSPDLIFPAPWTSAAVRDYVSRLETSLPAKILDQHFLRWLPAREGKDPRWVKLPRDWRQQPTEPVTDVTPAAG
jgi:hypothetical protein